MAFPVQIMKTMFSIDLEENMLCNGLHLTDLMTFKDNRPVDKFEEMICKMNITVLMDEIMKQPMIQDLTNTVC